MLSIFTGYRKAILTRIRSIKRQDKEACTGVIRKKLYELVNVLQSYDSNKVFYRVFARMYGY